MNTGSSSQIQYAKVKQLIDFIKQKGAQFSDIFQYLSTETYRRVDEVYGGNAAETFNSKLKTISTKTEETLNTLMTTIAEEFNFNLEEYQKLDQRNANNV